MKNIKLAAALAVFGTVGMSAQNALTINITNLVPSKGNIEIGIFNKAEGFLKPGKQIAQKTVKAVGKSISYTFNLPKGDYAVAVYQDENSNRKCDTNMIGIPTEGFGFSNNYRPKLSAPSFSQTKFSINGNKSITISLIQ